MEAKSSVLKTKKTLSVEGKIIDLTIPRIMGILNITPDSFYAGSRMPDVSQSVETAGIMLEQGATFLDVGGYSSRPGADDIAVSEEIDRILPVIEALRANFPEAVISIDTFRAAVAKSAIQAGGQIINDISGGQMDADMLEVVADLRVPYIMMHMKGTPQTMKELAKYDDLTLEMVDYFSKRIKLLVDKGHADIVVDPGFGFAKTIGHNFKLLEALGSLLILEHPIMIGLSRKSMIYKTLNITAEEALNGTTALHMAALMKGADILRVHDVKEAVETVQLFKAMKG